MGLLKRTYALPPETVMSFERNVPKGKRSVLLAALMREWLQERERVRLRQAIVRGCQEMGAEYLAMEGEFHPIEEEVDHEP
jgi:hypothetical protein